MTKVVAKLLDGFIRLGLDISHLGKSMQMITSVMLVEELKPIIKVQTKRGALLFSCPGHIPLWRAQTLLTKEPETIEWIDNFENNTVFWDIGANIGIYSLYAALNKTIQVFAFEPAAINYNILNENIKNNFFDNRIRALCIAFDNHTKIEKFYMSDTKVGSSLHAFGEAIDYEGKSFNPVFKQGMIGFTIDNFVSIFDIPFPDYIKIDVDGNEDKILHGGLKILKNNKMKSCLIELDSNRPEYCDKVIAFLDSCNISFTEKILQPDSDTSNGKLGIHNYIFHRRSRT